MNTLEAIVVILALLAAGAGLGAASGRVAGIADRLLTPLVLLLVFAVGASSSRAGIGEGGRASLVIAAASMAASMAAGVAVWKAYDRLSRRRPRSR